MRLSNTSQLLLPTEATSSLHNFSWNYGCRIDTSSLITLYGEELHENFQRFLTIAPVATTHDGAIADIKAFFSSKPFIYLNQWLADEQTVMTFTENTFELQGTNQHSLASNAGVCNQLALKAYRLILAKYPNLCLVLIDKQGEDFTRIGRGYNHCYLLTFDGSLTVNDTRTNESPNFDFNPLQGGDRIEYILRERPDKLYDLAKRLHIIDPSSNMVEPFQAGRYEVTGPSTPQSFTQSPRSIRKHLVEGWFAQPIGRGEMSNNFLDYQIGRSGSHITVSFRFKKQRDEPFEFFSLTNTDHACVLTKLSHDPQLMQCYSDIRLKFLGALPQLLKYNMTFE